MPRPAMLLDDISVEITARDTAALPAVAPALPAGTRVHMTHLGTEAPEARVATAAAARAADLVPVPHVAARRVPGERELAHHLAALRAVGAHERVCVIGGDPRSPAGPYADAAALLKSGILAAHGVAEVSLAGYPEGHPTVATEALWDALLDKQETLATQGHAGVVATQMSFDADAVLAWIAEARSRGITLPVRVGVPGPASVARLVTFARRCGVSTSAGIARKYGFSLTSLVGSAGPDRLVGDLLAQLDSHRDGDVRLHVYTFGNLASAAAWAARAEQLAATASTR